MSHGRIIADCRQRQSGRMKREPRSHRQAPVQPRNKSALPGIKKRAQPLKARPLSPPSPSQGAFNRKIIPWQLPRQPQQRLPHRQRQQQRRRLLLQPLQWWALLPMRYLQLLPHRQQVLQRRSLLHQQAFLRRQPSHLRRRRRSCRRRPAQVRLPKRRLHKRFSSWGILFQFHFARDGTPASRGWRNLACESRHAIAKGSIVAAKGRSNRSSAFAANRCSTRLAAL